MNVLLFDFETTPDVAYVFANKKYEQNIAKFIKRSYIISFACKWVGESKIDVYALPDCGDEKALLKKFATYVEKADVICAHNGDSFDVRVLNARMLRHGLPVLPPFKTIDTKKWARKYLRLPSYAMDDICDYYNLGKKLEHEGFKTWEGCMAGDKHSWLLMKKYNKHDIVLLEAVYNLLLPWIKNFPVIKYKVERTNTCPQCGSSHYQSRGRIQQGHRLHCQDCYKWFYKK